VYSGASLKQPITRRTFTKITGLGLVSTALGDALISPATAQDTMSRQLEEIILRNVKDFNDPWLLIHGVRAMGKNFSLQGQNVIDYLCSHCLQLTSINNNAYIYMPIDVERHSYCFLSEAILDAGIQKEYKFQRDGQNFTVRDLVESAKALYKPDVADPDTLAWSIIVFGYALSPENDKWQNANSVDIELSALLEAAFLLLEAGTQKLFHAMTLATDEPVSDGVHEFACAGTHLIYGLTTCLRLGYDDQLQKRMKAQFDLLIWRLQNDPKLIDAYYDQITDYPAAVTQMYRLDTKLKFLGHAFEIINSVELYKTFQITSEQDAKISNARDQLGAVVSEISNKGIENFKDDQVLFDLIIGDACHAYHAVGMGNTDGRRA
jgi:hypothetical protein